LKILISKHNAACPEVRPYQAKTDSLCGLSQPLLSEVAYQNYQLEILSEVGEDDVSAGAADGEERFVAGLFEIEPAFLGGGVDLGVLAGDLIGGQG